MNRETEVPIPPLDGLKKIGPAHYEPVELTEIKRRIENISAIISLNEAVRMIQLLLDQISDKHGPIKITKDDTKKPTESPLASIGSPLNFPYNTGLVESEYKRQTLADSAQKILRTITSQTDELNLLLLDLWSNDPNGFDDLVKILEDSIRK